MNAIGYIRRSTNRQEESLEQQRAKLETFAAARGWKLLEVFVDDAISGSDMNRPGLEAMVNRAQNDKDIGAVLAWERNRLARPKDPVDGLMLERRLINAGKRVFYVATGQEADRTFASGLISYVEHYQSGDYLRKLSRDTMRGHVARAERGLWCGGPIPFGYDRLYTTMEGKPKRIIRDMPDKTQQVLHPETGAILEVIPAGQRYIKPEYELCTLIPSEPARVAVVQKIFHDFDAGIPIRTIRKSINAMGMRSSRGRMFTHPTIHSILANPAYTGTSVYNQRTESKWHRHTAGQSQERYDEGLENRPPSDWIVKKDAWPAIIDQQTYDRAQQQRTESKRRYLHTRGSCIHHNYFLTPFLVCKICGSKLSGQTCTSGKGYKTRYYVCAAHHAGHTDVCPKRYQLPADIVENHILELIRADLEHLKTDAQLQQYIAEEIARLSGNDDLARQQLQRRLADIDQQTARLREHLKAMAHSTAQSLGLYTDAEALTEEKSTVEAELKRLDKKLPELPDAKQILEQSARELDSLADILATATVEQKKQFVARYIQKITADPNAKTVEISRYPALFSLIVAGEGFEPPTSGL